MCKAISTVKLLGNGTFAEMITPSAESFRKTLTELKKEYNQFESVTENMFSAPNQISLLGLKTLMKDNEIHADSLRKNMYAAKRKYFFDNLFHDGNVKKWKHSVNLSSDLSDKDYEDLMHFVNMHDGIYMKEWLGYSKTDFTPNLDKLMMFIRSMRRIFMPEFYQSMSKSDWEICIDGIINKPKEVTKALCEYKYNSRKINRGITGKCSKKIQHYIDEITKFLNTQSIKNDTTVYRGEGDFRVFGRTVDKNSGKTLEDLLEEFTKKIESNEVGDKEIEKFIEDSLIWQTVTQSRFMSTAMKKTDAERYAGKILWTIDVTKGTKGSMIESYNVERESETELLIQRGSNLFIKSAVYNKTANRWEIQAKIVQS